MTKTKRTLGAASAILATACGAFALHGQDSAAEGRSSDTPPEFGDVDWGRKLQDGLSASRDSKKPVMLLFQEVPGWSTCTTFGEGPLRLPLLVEAAETLFEPIVIRNNVAGYERDVLKRFEEPEWNNPVVRFIDADAKDVIPRKDRVWQTGPLLGRMSSALETAKNDVPEWLRLVAAETSAGEVDTAVFVMTWYWEGEAQLGLMDGVLNTRSSWVGKHEVVEVTYDKDVVEYAALLKTAIEEGCADRAFTANDAQLKTAKAQLGDRAQPLEGTPRPAKASEQLYYLERSEYAKLPLTPLQARRVNGALHAKQDASRFLSPRQIATRDRVREARTKDAKTNIVARLAKLERPDQLAGLADYATSLERTLSAQAK